MADLSGPLYQHFYGVLARDVLANFLARVESRLREELRDFDPDLTDSDPLPAGVSIDLQTMIDLLREVAEEEPNAVSG